jgi:hypothetical protein
MLWRWLRLLQRPASGSPVAAPPVPCPVETGQFVQWESAGSLQWTGSRRVIHVDHSDGVWYAWVEGSMTAIPAHQLIPDR